jgi:RecA/RadA recombinase
MAPNKRRKLESTISAIQQQHGARAIRPLRELVAALPPAIPTGFVALDTITGCTGIPRGALTLFSGPSTSGKSTVAYKALAQAQTGGATGVLLDLAHTVDPGYLQRCGVALDRLLIARPQQAAARVSLLLDVVQSGRARLVLVEGVAELTATQAQARHFNAALPRLRQLARTSGSAVLLLDETAPLWQRWLNLDAAAGLRQAAALHIELRREEWLVQEGVLRGYAARAQVVRSLWRGGAPSAPVAIVFNGTVHARTTW